MKLKYLIKLSTRTFRTRAGRTALTILGSAIGIAAIFVFVALGYGLQKLTLEQITTAESLLSLDISSPNENIPLNRQALEDIAAIPHVEEISFAALFAGQITVNDLTSGVNFYACSPSFFRLGGINPLAGRIFETENERSLVISSALAKSFDLSPDNIIGKNARVVLFGDEFANGANWKIIGITDDDTTPFAYFPHQAINVQITEFDRLKVKISNTKFINPAVDQIVEMGFLVSALSETIEEANKIFGAIQFVLALFGFVALMVGAIGMANTMTVTLLERTNEIGTMKAIGATDRDIGILFLTESVIMGFFSGLGGVAIGFLTAGTFNLAINLLAQSMGGQAISLFYAPPWFTAFIVIFSTLVGLFSGIFPSRKAAQMNPLEALRYK